MIKGKALDIKVRLQMSRSSNDKWYLYVEDNSSGVRVLEIHMNNDDLAALLSTRHTDPCVASYYPNEAIGLTHRCKTVPVKYSDLGGKFFSDYDAQEKDLKQLYDYAEQLNPGWEADRSEYNSRLNDRDKKTYEVILRKYEK